jgi:hypothetical protein
MAPKNKQLAARQAAQKRLAAQMERRTTLVGDAAGKLVDLAASREAVARLEDELADLLDELRGEGMSVDQVADVLGVDPNDLRFTRRKAEPAKTRRRATASGDDTKPSPVNDGNESVSPPAPDTADPAVTEVAAVSAA